MGFFTSLDLRGILFFIFLFFAILREPLRSAAGASFCFRQAKGK